MKENVYMVNEINVLTLILQTFFERMLTVNVTAKEKLTISNEGVNWYILSLARNNVLTCDKDIRYQKPCE